MSDKVIYLNLSEKEFRRKAKEWCELYDRHATFLDSLATGGNTQDSSIQRRFHGVLSGRLRPASDFEWAYLFHIGRVKHKPPTKVVAPKALNPQPTVQNTHKSKPLQKPMSAAQARKRRKSNAAYSTASLSIRDIVLPGVVYEPTIQKTYYTKSKVKVFEKKLREKPTNAEEALRSILNELNGGTLRGRFKFQYTISGKWIVDFFFPEIRLAIEVDGSIHDEPGQVERDTLKADDCRRLDITLLRIRNSEVFGDHDRLVEKLRGGWREALQRENRLIGKPYDTDSK